MLSEREVISTLNMLRNEHLDVRTVTLGVSLFDCVSHDLDLFTAVFFQDFSYFADIVCSTCKRCCNEIKSFLDTEEKIIMVFFTDEWHLQVCTRNIDTLLVANHTCINNLADNVLS